MPEVTQTTVLLSVKHTGTNTLLNLLWPPKARGKSMHLDNHEVDEYAKKSSLIVCPIRAPVECFASWHKRHGFSDLDGAPVDNDHGFFNEWRRLDEMYAMDKTVVVPVDLVGVRDEQFNKLRGVHRRPDPDNWPQENKTQETNPLPLPGINWGEIYNLKVVRHFGYEVPND